jgi:hypothetical protein
LVNSNEMIKKEKKLDESSDSEISDAEDRDCGLE